MPSAHSAGPRGPACAAQYSIKCSSMQDHYDIRSGGSERILYHIKLPSTFRKPTLTIHEGSSPTGRVVGACKYNWPEIEVGLGDINRPSSVKWERLTRDGVLSPSYTFRVAFGKGLPQRFTWKRTRNLGRNESWNWKLVNEESQKVAALFEGPKGWAWGLSDLSIYAHDHEEQFNFMVLLTLMAFNAVRPCSAGGAAVGGGGA